MVKFKVGNLQHEILAQHQDAATSLTTQAPAVVFSSAEKQVFKKWFLF